MMASESRRGRNARHATGLPKLRSCFKLLGFRCRHQRRGRLLRGLRATLIGGATSAVEFGTGSGGRSESHTFIINASTEMSRQEPRAQRQPSSRMSVPMRAARAFLEFSGTLAWMRADRISPITQYFDTISRSSPSVTELWTRAGWPITVQANLGIFLQARPQKHYRLCPKGY
jgi:hypothetical protein